MTKDRWQRFVRVYWEMLGVLLGVIGLGMGIAFLGTYLSPWLGVPLILLLIIAFCAWGASR